MVKLNKARGEVLLTLGDEEFVLHGSFGNLAAFQTALNVDGLAAMMRLVQVVDARALLEGVRCLAISGDTSSLDELPFMSNMNTVQEAILATVSAGMAPESGNVTSETETTQ